MHGRHRNYTLSTLPLQLPKKKKKEKENEKSHWEVRALAWVGEGPGRAGIQPREQQGLGAASLSPFPLVVRTPRALPALHPACSVSG